MITCFNDLVKFCGNLSDLKKIFAKNVADSYGIYLCGADGIDINDLKLLFRK